MNYNGSKSNCYQRIINYMPPHTTYIETHAGSAAIARNKYPAETNILIDIDRDVIRHIANDDQIGIYASDGDIVDSTYSAVHADCVGWLESNPTTRDTLIYSDPPYLMSTRSSKRNYYKHEYTDADHVRLLNCLKSLDCMVLVSGYDSDLYNDMLSGWTVATFTAQSRGGIRNEYLWYNYPEPTKLHDYRYLGSNFTERQRIKRKAERWSDRFLALPRLERLAIIHRLQDDGAIDN